VASTARVLQKLLRSPDDLKSVAHELSYLLARNEEARCRAYLARDLIAAPKLPPSRRHTLMPEHLRKPRNVSQ
jgi:hypothetical protein